MQSMLFQSSGTDRPLHLQTLQHRDSCCYAKEGLQRCVSVDTWRAELSTGDCQEAWDASYPNMGFCS
eukprot:6360981-Amphidinium_carterae.1